MGDSLSYLDNLLIKHRNVNVEIFVPNGFLVLR